MPHGTTKRCHLSLVGANVPSSRAPLPDQHTDARPRTPDARAWGLGVTGSTIVRTELEGGATVATCQLDCGEWLIAISDSIEPNSAEEHMTLAAARKAIALWTMGFRQPEGGVDCLDLWPVVVGPRIDPAPKLVPEPRREVMLRPGFAAVAIAPLTALAAMVALFQDHLAIFTQ